MRELLVNIKNCARCGKNHDQLLFKVFTVPIEKNTHFAICPELNEPILCEIKNIDESYKK